MTREEADFIGSMNMCDEISNEAYKKIMCHCEDQEHCEDAISRQAVLSKIKEVCFSKEWIQFRADYGSHGQRDFLINYIEGLPHVTSSQKIGKWLNGELIPNDITGHWYAECSECGKMRIVDNYCPNCGAKMEIEDEISE